MKIHIKENQLEEIEGLSTEYPYAYHYADLQEAGIPWHWHEELELNYIVEGSVRVSTVNREYVFREKEAFFINTNVLCSFENENSGKALLIDSHLFHPVFLSGHFKSIFATKYLEPVMQDKKLEILELRGENTCQKEIIRKLCQASGLQRQENTEFQTRNLFSDIWLLLLEEWKLAKGQKNSVRPANQARIQTMLSFIHQNYSEKITLEEIAHSAAVSKRECLRCFQSCIHKTPSEYLIHYRLEAAQRLLRTTELPVTEIALRTGFGSSAYFGKLFRRMHGETPGGYRKRAAKAVGLSGIFSEALPR